MKIEQTNIHDPYDYTNGLMIKVDGNKVIDVGDGEPEDNTLMRNFNDCYSIVALMRMAYEAGKRGEDFDVTTTTIEED